MVVPKGLIYDQEPIVPDTEQAHKNHNPCHEKEILFQRLIRKMQEIRPKNRIAEKKGEDASKHNKILQ